MGKQTTVNSILLVDESAPADSKIYRLTNSGGDLVIEALSDDLATVLGVLEVERDGITSIDGAELQTQLSVVSSLPNTTPPFSYEATGTDGSKVEWHVGTQDPEGNVTANAGAMYVFVDSGTPADCKVFQKRSSGAVNTGWVAL